MEFLESMSRMADLAEHEDNCGQCEHQRIMAQTAKDLMPNGTIDQWSKECQSRWESSKYYKLWKEEQSAGRDPKIAFEKLGWEA
jgi:hypothetical protein